MNHANYLIKRGLESAINFKYARTFTEYSGMAYATTYGGIRAILEDRHTLNKRTPSQKNKETMQLLIECDLAISVLSDNILPDSVGGKLFE